MIVAVWGDEKTAKTTLGLTFPKSIKHFDVDLGFQRAAGRFKAEIEAGEIVTKRYPMPLQMNSRLKGMRELWEEFQKDYYEAATDAKWATLMVDSGTQLYELVRLAFLQEKQEAQLKRGLKAGENLRESLLPVEYSEPFARLDAVYYAAKSVEKHLVVTHFSRDERMDRVNPVNGNIESVTTGKMELDGYKRTARQVDVVLYTYAVSSDPKDKNSPQTPWGLVMLSALGVNGLKMVGQRLMEPTYQKLIDLAEMV